MLREVYSAERPILPPHGSHALTDEVLSWGVFETAVKHIPSADVAAVTSVCTASPPERVAVILAANRLMNPICEGCGWKPGPDRRHHCRLKLCAGCCLAWFCSQECVARNVLEGTSLHGARCVNDPEALAAAPLDTGPQAIAIVPLAH